MSKLAEAPWGAATYHRVELKNLQPGTTYYFQAETGQAAGSEVERIFSVSARLIMERLRFGNSILRWSDPKGKVPGSK